MIKRNIKKIIDKPVDYTHSNKNNFIKIKNIYKFNFIHFSKVIPIIVIFSLLTTINLFHFSNGQIQNTTNESFELTFQGVYQENLGNYTGAIELYDKALAIDSNNTYTLLMKGNILTNLGNYSGAITTYDRALTVDPNDTSILLFKGITLSDLGNYTDAIKYHDKALTVDPDDIFNLNNKGIALRNLGNYTDAIKYHDKALTVDPNDTYALYNKGISLNDLGNYTDSINTYDKLLMMDPNNMEALNNRDNVLSTVNLINEVKSRQQSNNLTNLTREVTISDLQLGSHLIRDPNAFAVFGDAYRVDHQAGIYIIFNNNKSNSNVYQLPSSAQNLVQASDSRIGVDITFKMPVSHKSTLESIERINGLYDVRYIDKQPTYTTFIAFSNSPITVNNTDYSDLTIEVKQLNNATGYLYLKGFKG